MGRQIAVAADDEMAPLIAVGPKGGDGTSLPLSRFAELNLGITNATSRIDEKTRQPHKSGSSAVVSAMGGRGWGRQQEE